MYCFLSLSVYTADNEYSSNYSAAGPDPVRIITLDTNVIISAVVFGGKPRNVFELVLEGKYDLALSGPILNEVKGVLTGKKFGYPGAAADAVINQLEALGMMVYPVRRILRIKADPADNRILACAVESGSAFIVSGDKHLLELGTYKDVRIVTPDVF